MVEGRMGRMDDLSLQGSLSGFMEPAPGTEEAYARASAHIPQTALRANLPGPGKHPMTTSPCLKWLRSPLVALGLLLVVVLTCNAEPGWVGYVPTCLEDLQQLGPDQLTDLFMRSEVGHPLVGVARGRLLYLTDKM